MFDGENVAFPLGGGRDLPSGGGMRSALPAVHADGSATQLHTAADVLPFLAAAVQAAPATAVEHHPVAGQPGLHAVTVLARYRPPGDRDLNVLDAVVPRSVASVYHRGTQLLRCWGCPQRTKSPRSPPGALPTPGGPKKRPTAGWGSKGAEN